MINSFNNLENKRYIEKTIQRVQKFADHCQSQQIRSIATKAMKELQSNIAQVQWFEKTVRLFPSILQGMARRLLSYFATDQYLITTRESQAKYHTEFQNRVEQSATEEVEKLAQELIKNSLAANRSKNRPNTIDNILNKELIDSLIEKSKPALCHFKTGGKLRIILNALDKQIRFHSKKSSDLKFQINSIVSNVYLKKAIDRVTKEQSIPVFYIDLGELPNVNRPYLIQHLQEQKQKKQDMISQLEKRSKPLIRGHNLAEKLHRLQKELNEIQSQITKLSSRESKGFLRVEIKEWESLANCFVGGIPEKLFEFEANAKLERVMATRAGLLADLSSAASVLIPFPDPAQLYSNNLPVSIVQSTLNSYFTAIRSSPKLPGLLQLNHLCCVAKWLTTHNPVLAEEIAQYTKDRMEKLTIDRFPTSAQLSSHEQELIYLCQLMTDSKSKSKKMIDRTIDPEIQAMIADYTLSIASSAKHAKRLAPLSAEGSIWAFDPRSYGEYLKSFRYKFRVLSNPSRCREILDRAESLWQSYKNGTVSAESQKLTLGELGTLEDMKKVEEQLSKLNTEGPLQTKIDIKEIRSLTSRAQGLYQAIESQAQQEGAAAYQNGNIAMTDFERQKSFMRYSPKIEQWLTYLLVSRFTHAAKIYIDQAGEDRYPRQEMKNSKGSNQASVDPEAAKPKNRLYASHVCGNYQTTALNLRDLVINNYYQLDLKKLVKDELVEQIENHMPDHFWEVAKRKYEEIEKRIHTERSESFRTINNSRDARFEAGYAKYGLRSKNMENAQGNEIKKIRDQIFEIGHFREGAMMICSEFASRTTTAALYEFDQWLQKKLRKRDIQVVTDRSGMGALQIPIGANRRYETIYPEEIVELYKNRGAISRLPYPKVINALVKDLD